MLTTATESASDQQDPRYQAMVAHDARFDGRFFVGVATTGVYCRPVCRVRLPRYRSCHFFEFAAQAESAGFRPCLRCRPELAPQIGAEIWSTADATRTLALQALQHIERNAGHTTPMALAVRLGVSDRHLRRIMEEHCGLSPLQAIQTQRLLHAKAMLTDTSLPIAEVAVASGFDSVRRFNSAFVDAYRMPPSRLRKVAPQDASSSGSITLRLSYRPPFDVRSLLTYFQNRQINAIEYVAKDLACASVESAFRCHGAATGGSKAWTGWVRAEFDLHHPLVRLQVAPSLAGVLPQVTQQVRAWLDLDADPLAIDGVLAKDFPALTGLRVPGCLDGFMLAARAILGQQVTVAAGRTFVQRVADAFGEPLAPSHRPPGGRITRLFPSPSTVARLSESALGELGIVSQRQRALIGLARALVDGSVALDSRANPDATMRQLMALPGVGPWTANYIAMRALKWPDAFPAGDVALQKALGIGAEDRKRPKSAQRTAIDRSRTWQPWRSYAVMRAWATNAMSNHKPKSVTPI